MRIGHACDYSVKCECRYRAWARRSEGNSRKSKNTAAYYRTKLKRFRSELTKAPFAVFV